MSLIYFARRVFLSGYLKILGEIAIYESPNFKVVLMESHHFLNLLLKLARID